MRLFIALDIDDQIRQRIGRFLEGVSGFSPDARWVRLESLHVTLKFIGEKPPDIIPSLQKALDNVSVPPFDLTFSGYGFLSNPKIAARLLDRNSSAAGTPETRRRHRQHHRSI